MKSMLQYQFTGLFLLFFSFLMLRCKEENPDRELFSDDSWACYEQTAFECSGITATTFFKGKLNGAEFCINEGENNYVTRNFIADTPPVSRTGVIAGISMELVPNNFFDFYKPEIQINYYAGGKYSQQEIVDNILKPQELPIITALDDIFVISGITLRMSISCPDDNPGSQNSKSGLPFNTFGPQSDATFVIKKVDVSETATEKIYQVTAEMRCKLYKGKRFWRELTDATFSTEIRVKK